MTLVPDDYLWCQRLVHYFLVCYEEEKINQLTLATPATLSRTLIFNPEFILK